MSNINTYSAIKPHHDSSVTTDNSIAEWKFNEEIGIFLTRRCPLRCAHCVVSSDPSYDDPPESEIAMAVEQVAAMESIRHVSITGGEPFLRAGLLRDCCTRLIEAGKQVSVVTSGHWATTSTRALAVLSNVLGKTREVHLWISMDPHHSKFLPDTHYINAINAANALAIPVGVKAVYHERPEEAMDFVEQAIPLPARNILSNIYLQPLFALGRAETLEYAPQKHRALPSGLCGKCAPLVNENGDVTACCGTFDLERDNPLHLGNTRDDDLSSILERSNNDWLIQAIRTLGPARLWKLAFGEETPDRTYLRHDICSLCDELMGSPETVQQLRNVLETRPKLRRKIAAVRFGLYGEHDMLETTEGETPCQRKI